jgi:hypothetical protein
MWVPSITCLEGCAKDMNSTLRITTYLKAYTEKWDHHLPGRVYGEVAAF